MLTVRSGFSWWGGGDVSAEATGSFSRKVGPCLSWSNVFRTALGVPHTGKVERRRNVSHNRTQGPWLPWPRGCVARCHLVIHDGFCAASLRACMLVLYIRQNRDNFHFTVNRDFKKRMEKNMMGQKSTCLHQVLTLYKDESQTSGVKECHLCQVSF